MVQQVSHGFCRGVVYRSTQAVLAIGFVKSNKVDSQWIGNALVLLNEECLLGDALAKGISTTAFDGLYYNFLYIHLR